MKTIKKFIRFYEMQSDKGKVAVIILTVMSLSSFGLLIVNLFRYGI